jgi:hypothetical protein
LLLAMSMGWSNVLMSFVFDPENVVERLMT